MSCYLSMEWNLSDFNMMTYTSYQENGGFNCCNNPLKDWEITITLYLTGLVGKCLRLQFSYKVQYKSLKVGEKINLNVTSLVHQLFFRKMVIFRTSLIKPLFCYIAFSLDQSTACTCIKAMNPQFISAVSNYYLAQL